MMKKLYIIPLILFVLTRLITGRAAQYPLSLTDKSKQEYFHSIPTSFSLSADQVDRLRDAATHLLYASPDFQRLVQDINGQIMTSPVGKVDDP